MSKLDSIQRKGREVTLRHENFVKSVNIISLSKYTNKYIVDRKSDLIIEVLPSLTQRQEMTSKLWIV